MTALTNSTLAPLEVFADELVRAGVKHAVIAPGSRNAPLIDALAGRDELRCWSQIDERVAGFFALGIAKATGEPVAITCTSGTAAANLHPAIAEASESNVPLLVLTADRPPELRGVGAGQAIDQIKLYGDAVRLFVEVGNFEACSETLQHFRALACRAVSAATGKRPGPVHLNFSLREPLAAVVEDLGSLAGEDSAIGRPHGACWTTINRAAPVAWNPLEERLAASERPVIVCGEQPNPALGVVLAEFSRRAGVPVLADPLSQLRFAGLDGVFVLNYDLLLRSEAITTGLSPDLIIRIGALPASKPLCTWLAANGKIQIFFDPTESWHDPSAAAAEVVQADPTESFRAIASPNSAEAGWRESWLKCDAIAHKSAVESLQAKPFAVEPLALMTAIAAAPEDSVIFVSSSMPIRDVESFGSLNDQPLQYLANRGANGIDGVVSSALGARAAIDRPVMLLIGDVALTYDIGGLMAARRLGLDLTIVCVDNDGGGIFSFLPVAEHSKHFNELIATPPGVDIEALAGLAGLRYSTPSSYEELSVQSRQPGLVHLRTQRDSNVVAHQEAYAAVNQALSEAGV